MKYSIAIFLSLHFFAPITFAQVTFQKTFAIGTYAQANCIRQTGDGGYIIAGFGGDYPNHAACLIRTDVNGDTLWTRTFGIGGTVFGASAEEASDGGFILCGKTGEFPPFDIFLVKVNANGNLLWSKTYDEGTYDWGNSVLQTSDGGYLVAGSVIPPGLTQTAMTLIKTDSDGNVMWSNIYDANFEYFEVAWSVKQTSDGGFIIGGEAEGGACLIKTDNFGNIEWTKYYSTGVTTRFYEVQQTSDGGYIGVGYFGGPTKLLIIKTNSQGDTLWVRIYGHGFSDVAYSVQQNADHGYIVSGVTIDNGDADACMIKTDSSGNIQWSKSYDLPLSLATAFSVRETADGGYVFAGHTAPADYKIYFVKTDSNGNSFCNENTIEFLPMSHAVTVASPVFSISSSLVDSTVDFLTGSGVVDSRYCSVATLTQFAAGNDKQVSIFPNPFSLAATINFSGKEKYDLRMFDVFGTEVMRAENISGSYVIDRRNIPSGIYLYEVFSEKKKIQTGKAIAE